MVVVVCARAVGIWRICRKRACAAGEGGGLSCQSIIISPINNYPTILLFPSLSASLSYNACTHTHPSRPSPPHLTKQQKNCNLFEEGTVEPWQFEAMVSLIEEVEFEEGHYFSKEGLKVGLPDTAIYFVRDGAITVSNTMGQMAELTSGAYFGESTLKMFWEAMQESSSSSVENMEPQILAPSTAYCMKDCKLGALSLSAIEAIMGTTSFHLKRATPFHNFKTVQKHWKAMDGIIQMSDIVKHSILGVGTFGKVWLVSKKLDAAAVKAKERRTVYALKIQNKTELLEHNQVNGVIREMNIMTSIDSPFIIKLYNTYQDERDIYMLIGLVQGGELFSVIHSPTRDNINEVDAKFYAAGILLGLEYMHSRHILYRDLKPENVLIDNKGYPVIVDLGFGEFRCMSLSRCSPVTHVGTHCAHISILKRNRRENKCPPFIDFFSFPPIPVPVPVLNAQN